MKTVVKPASGSGPVGLIKFIPLAFLLLLALFFLRPGFDYSIYNRVVAAITVWNSVSIDISKLSSSLSEADVLSLYSELNMNCGQEPSALGGRSCYANIKKINGSDAWFVVFFFNGDKLSQVKMDFTPSGHEGILRTLESQFGEPSKIKKSTQAIPLIKWALKQGLLITNVSAYRERTTQVIWLSHNEIFNRWRQSAKRTAKSDGQTRRAIEAGKRVNNKDEKKQAIEVE